MVLTPEDMQSPSVERAFFVGAGVGYIRVASFDENTAKELKEAIEKLGGDRMVGLVLDLRNNPGGLVTAALDTAALFLKPGAKIVTVRGRHVPEKSETVPSIAMPYGFKLAILVNEKTASASEIVTGAMQDHDRATVLGEPSYGKGLVQSVFPLSQNTGLALTTALYYTPSGRSIQKPLDAARFELAATTAHPNTASVFHTDSGRVVTGGGGIQPDYRGLPAAHEPACARCSTPAAQLHQFRHPIPARPQGIGRLRSDPAGARPNSRSSLSERGIQPGCGETGRRSATS